MPAIRSYIRFFSAQSSLLGSSPSWRREMLDGVVRFPAEFAARYRAKGYWEDRSLRDTFDELFARHADRIAVIDRDRSVTYAQLNERATRLAFNLLDEGLKPLDRVVVQLPNVVEFVYLYFALQKIGCDPDHGAADAPLSRNEPVRRTLRRRRLRHAGPDQRLRLPRPRPAHSPSEQNSRLGIILGETPQGFCH